MRPVFRRLAWIGLAGLGGLFAAAAAWRSGLGSPDFGQPELLPPVSGAVLQPCPDDPPEANSGFDRRRPGTATQPESGRWVADPHYGTCLQRLTDGALQPSLRHHARNDYSRRQAFNADGSRFFLSAGDGSWHLFDAASGRHLGPLADVGGDAEPQWHATDPGRLYFVANNGGMSLHELDLHTGVSRRAVDFRGRLPWPDAAHVWTRSEGSPSRDGRYWCLQVDDGDFQGLGVFVLDLQEDRILGTLDSQGRRPDHVSMSPSGRYCVVSWTDEKGTVAYDQKLGNPRRLHGRSEHSDLAIDATGRDVFVSVDYDSRGGPLFMVDLGTGTRTNLLDTYLAGTATALHVSGKSFDRPGWIVVSTYAEHAGLLRPFSWRWLHGKVFLLPLQADPVPISLLHHHSEVEDYFAEPHASPDRTLGRILFNSNWQQPDGRVEAYMLKVPPLPPMGVAATR